MTFRVNSVETFGGSQIILWLEDEQTGTTDSGKGEWCVRVPLTEAPAFLAELAAAYTETMQRLAIELAAGGCRTCSNKRSVVDGRPFVGILDDPDAAVPCPVCIPRAETRIRAVAFVAQRPPRGSD